MASQAPALPAVFEAQYAWWPWTWYSTKLPSVCISAWKQPLGESSTSPGLKAVFGWSMNVRVVALAGAAPPTVAMAPVTSAVAVIMRGSSRRRERPGPGWESELWRRIWVERIVKPPGGGALSGANDRLKERGAGAFRRSTDP